MGALHRVGQEYALREVSEGLKLHLPEIAYQAKTLDMLVSLYQQPPVALARLNPAWSPDQELSPGTLNAITDLGYAPLAAACPCTTRAPHPAPGAPRPSNPTAIDTLLARLLLARQPQEPENLQRLQEIPNV